MTHMKQFACLWLLLLLPCKGIAQTGEPQIGEQPTGDPTDYYYLNDELRATPFGYMTRNMREIQFYFNADGVVYMRDWVDYGAYLKGTYDAAAGTISFPNKQNVERVQFGVGSKMQMMYFAVTDPATGLPKTDNLVLQVKTVGGKRVISAEKDINYGLFYDDEGQTHPYWLARRASFINKTTVDALTTTVHYTAMDYSDGSDPVDRRLSCVAIGNDIYLKGIDGIFSNIWTHAVLTIDNGTPSLLIPNDQYVSNYSVKENFLMKTGTRSGETPPMMEGHQGIKFTMTHDAPNHIYKCTAPATDVIGIVEAFTDGRLSWATVYGKIEIELPESMVSGTTGIDRIATDKADVSTDRLYYDLQGRPTTTPAHGIFIHHGKKVVVE